MKKLPALEVVAKVKAERELLLKDQKAVEEIGKKRSYLGSTRIAFSPAHRSHFSSRQPLDIW